MNTKFFKKVYHFISHNNVVIVALELAIFVGVIFAFAATEIGDRLQVTGDSEELTGYSLQVTGGEEQGTGNSEQGTVEQYNNETTTSEQIMVSNEQSPAENELLNNNQSLSKIETVTVKYEQAAEIKAKYQLDGDALKREVKSDPKDRIEVTIGNDEMPDISLRRWDEVGFDIEAHELLKDVPTENKNLKFVGDKIVYETPEMSFDIYEYTDGEGGMKYIWYLNEKPPTNKIEFPIESEGLDFFYQPPLTQKYQNGYSKELDREIVVSETQVKDLEGNVLVERPENVVGSYAVYHSTKGGLNDINGKEYKTGKAFHIFRPKIIDAKGKETWGILKIENGVYSVEIPQEFLDKAVYPIRSNDTFGYDTKGSSTTDNNIVNHILGSVFSCSSTGDGSKISAYIGGQSGKSIKAAIYIHSSSGLLENSDTGGEKDTSQGKFWYDFNLSPNVSLSAVDYVLVVWGNEQYVDVKYDSGSTNQGHDDAQTYNSFPDSASFTHDDNKYSIYATYTPSGEEEEEEYQPRPGGVGVSGGGFLQF